MPPLRVEEVGSGYYLDYYDASSLHNLYYFPQFDVRRRTANHNLRQTAFYDKPMTRQVPVSELFAF